MGIEQFGYEQIKVRSPRNLQQERGLLSNIDDLSSAVFSQNSQATDLSVPLKLLETDVAIMKYVSCIYWVTYVVVVKIAFLTKTRGEASKRLDLAFMQRYSLYQNTVERLSPMHQWCHLWYFQSCSGCLWLWLLHMQHLQNLEGWGSAALFL